MPSMYPGGINEIKNMSRFTNYIENQWAAMRKDERTYLLFSDRLGSSSVVMKANGELVEKAYYLPWGGTRGEEAITSTDYGYTGQMREGDIYYYGARWYDPSIGRFMQADTIVPLQVQGTQAFDRYAYVNNNPLRYTDPSGHYYQECGDDNYGRCGTISPPQQYNIIVCGFGDGNNCGVSTPNTPLYPYQNWNGENLFFDVDQFENKARTFDGILPYFSKMSGRSKVRFIGHSAGADTILLVLEELLRTGSRFSITGIVLLDPSLSGAHYESVGDMLPIVNNIIESSIPMYIVTTVDYPTDSSIPVSQYLPTNNTEATPNYYYYNIANAPNLKGLSHSGLALSIDIASMIWSWHQGK